MKRGSSEHVQINCLLDQLTTPATSSRVDYGGVPNNNNTLRGPSFLLPISQLVQHYGLMNIPFQFLPFTDEDSYTLVKQKYIRWLHQHYENLFSNSGNGALYSTYITEDTIPCQLSLLVSAHQVKLFFETFPPNMDSYESFLEMAGSVCTYIMIVNSFNRNDNSCLISITPILFGDYIVYEAITSEVTLNDIFSLYQFYDILKDSGNNRWKLVEEINERLYKTGLTRTLRQEMKALFPNVKVVKSIYKKDQIVVSLSIVDEPPPPPSEE